jgi:hypothetical protein
MLYAVENCYTVFMTELKTTQNNDSVDDFINTIDDAQKHKDSQILNKLMQKATGEKPVMWGKSIVGYGSYSYKYSNGKEATWMLVGFSPRKANITVYIMSGFDKYADASGYDPKPLLDKLGRHSTAKSCLYIKRLEDVNTDVLKQLVKESVDHLRKKQ